jgi:ferredoxin
MAERINPQVLKEIKEFGVKDWNACYHCGNCTASCPLTSQGFVFPRKEIRLMQMGLNKELVQCVEPWLCYYCGDCTKTCPRDANPGEIMMSLRRYLTSLYDWTGLSKKFYTSKIWEIGAIAFIAAIVIILFAVFMPARNIDPTLTEDGGVKVTHFANFANHSFNEIIEYGDWTMAIIVALLLITNIFNMYLKTIWADKNLIFSLKVYLREFWHLIFNFGTQAKFSKCNDRNYWLSHWLLMSGYTIMFIVIVVFLKWFQTDEIYSWWHPQRLLGYYATFGLLFGLIVAVIGRLKKEDIKFKFSHVSDWLFLIMLILTTITGILIHIFRLNGMPYATYYLYVIHLAILVPMIIIEVPFSKWSHLAYRPFAIYFSKIKEASVRKVTA